MVEAITQLPDLVIANQTAVQWSELQSLGDVWTETIFNRTALPFSPKSFVQLTSSRWRRYQTHTTHQ